MTQPAETLHRYHEAFDELGTEAEELAQPLTPEQFNWTSEPERWSVGQCIDHLNTAGYQLLPRLERALRKGRERGLTGAPPFRYGIISRWFIRFNKPSSGFKMTTFKTYEPTTDSRLDKEETVERFVALQHKLAAKVEEADGLDLRKIRAPSPVSRWLRLSVGAWFEGTIAHERRHLQQARAVTQEANFPSGL